MKKNILLLINGFGIEQADSVNVYDEKLMPNMDRLTKEKLFASPSLPKFLPKILAKEVKALLLAALLAAGALYSKAFVFFPTGKELAELPASCCMGFDAEPVIILCSESG